MAKAFLFEVNNKKIEQSKTVALSMGAGDQIIVPDAGKVLSSVTVEKPSTLVAENIKDGVTIGGVTGNYTTPSPTLITKNITANGTYNAQDDDADGYSSVTVNVPATPAAPVAENDVNFYDYDGTLVASYTAADFANLSAMPANPSHTGLVAEGWNWTLADAKTYVASYGKLNIGQMYATASGKTEYDIEVNEATGMTATLSGTSGTEKDWGDGTTDTLESHTYATAGNYTIKLSGTILPSVRESKKLRAVRIASGVTSIGAVSVFIFYACRWLTTITIPNSVISIVRSQFTACNLKALVIPNGVTEIPMLLCPSNTLLRTVAIPSSVTSIGNNAFQQCTALTSVTLPSSVTSIGNNAFQQCTALTSVTLPSSVTSIGTSEFSKCTALTSVTLPSSVTSIGTSAFQQCTALMSVTLPSSVTSIGNYAFGESNWLTIVTVLATTPPTVDSNSFPSNVTKIYIPNGRLASYQTDTNWSTYASKLVELPA